MSAISRGLSEATPHRHQVKLQVSWLGAFGQDIGTDGANRWFIECPGKAAHANGPRDCVVTQEHNGRLGGHCLHTSCGMGSWQDIRDAIGPLHSADFPQRSRSTGATNGHATTSGPLADEGNSRAGLKASGDEQPPQGPVKNFAVRIVQNEKSEPEEEKFPLPITAITDDIWHKTGNGPRRVGEMLFAPHFDSAGVTWLKNPESLFGSLGERTGHPSEFIGGHSHTRSEVFNHLPRVVQEYAAVESLPHPPPMDGHYYACREYPPGDGSRLRELIDRFSPETDVDRDLIVAAFVTPFWGGHGGTRPAFCLTSDAGRGCGKSKLAAFIADLAGGALNFQITKTSGL